MEEQLGYFWNQKRVDIASDTNLWQQKLVTLVLLLVITLLFGLIPILIVRCVKKREPGGSGLSHRLKTIISLLNCFAGGVFLGTTMLHLIPESREGVEQFLEAANIKTHLALSEFIISMGFFLVLLIEHLAIIFCGRRTAREAEGTDESRDESTSLLGSAENRNYQALQDELRSKIRVRGEGSRHEYRRGQGEHGEDPAHGHTHINVFQFGTFRAVTMLLALSLHTLFEGLAIGLEETASGVWALFTAIVVHKSVIAFSMGIQFGEKLKTYCRASCFIVIFAIMSPIGVAIGIVIMAGNGSNESINAVAAAVLQALAAGTFLYVTFFEVLFQELSSDHSLLKVLFVVLGFTAMTLLNTFVGEPDDD